jgi:hypothetical protein
MTKFVPQAMIVLSSLKSTWISYIIYTCIEGHTQRRRPSLHAIATTRLHYYYYSYSYYFYYY